jgi:N-hydroxyarylamine O-acetyltransferase
MSNGALDLDRYRERIGLTESEAPSLALLRTIIARHARAIPFENLDVILGRPIQLDIESIQAKLVRARRGGYCFEQNTLLRAALEQFGFRVSSLMARVVRGNAADAVTSRTHMLLRVELPEGAYLADVGFGNLTPTAPLRLDTEDAQPTEHEHFRLQRLNGEILLQACLSNEWENIYRFYMQSTYPVDHEVGNWFTSTRPGGLFTENVIAACAGTRCRKTFFNGEVTVRDLDRGTERLWLHDQTVLRDTLREQFGIGLQEDDFATIFSAMRRFADRPVPGFRLD